MNALSNARQPDETFENYRARLLWVKARIRQILKGQPALASKCGGAYLPGPNPTHREHPVIKDIILRDGSPDVLRVIHPGTLWKQSTLDKRFNK